MGVLLGVTLGLVDALAGHPLRRDGECRCLARRGRALIKHALRPPPLLLALRIPQLNPHTIPQCSPLTVPL
jgi:hypothetical protein